jgi:hypothetical protein
MIVYFFNYITDILFLYKTIEFVKIPTRYRITIAIIRLPMVIIINRIFMFLHIFTESMQLHLDKFSGRFIYL